MQRSHDFAVLNFSSAIIIIKLDTDIDCVCVAVLFFFIFFFRCSFCLFLLYLKNILQLIK